MTTRAPSWSRVAPTSVVPSWAAYLAIASDSGSSVPRSVRFPFLFMASGKFRFRSTPFAFPRVYKSKPSGLSEKRR